jgi:hypothetical protein
MLLYARNFHVYVALVKQKDPEGWLLDRKLICSCPLVTNSCYCNVDGKLTCAGSSASESVPLSGARLELAQPRQRCWFEAESWAWPTWEKKGIIRHQLACGVVRTEWWITHAVQMVFMIKNWWLKLLDVFEKITIISIGNITAQLLDVNIESCFVPKIVLWTFLGYQCISLLLGSSGWKMLLHVF